MIRADHDRVRRDDEDGDRRHRAAHHDDRRRCVDHLNALSLGTS